MYARLEPPDGGQLAWEGNTAVLELDDPGPPEETLQRLWGVIKAAWRDPGEAGGEGCATGGREGR